LGQEHVLRLEDPGDTSECIALTIGINEGAINAQDGVTRLRRRGIVGRTLDRVLGALL
jgi:hypothetical protein